MEITRKILFLTIICFSSSIAQLTENDCVIFLGNSITEAGVTPDGYVTLVNRAIQRAYPRKSITVLSAGVSGNKVPDCQKRLKSDVLEKKPTIVFIVVGINDIWHWETNEGTTKEQYKTGLHDIIDRIKKSDATAILCTPTVIGEKIDGSNKYDSMLDDYADISRAVAKVTESQLLDLRREFVKYLKKHNSRNKVQGMLTVDSIHLNKKGNKFLANLVLRALKVPVTY